MGEKEKIPLRARRISGMRRKVRRRTRGGRPEWTPRKCPPLSGDTDMPDVRSDLSFSDAPPRDGFRTGPVKVPGASDAGGFGRLQRTSSPGLCLRIARTHLSSDPCTDT